MTQQYQPPPAEPHSNAVKEGVAVELSDEGLRNLAGYFDVLIQMDFASKQRNERTEDATGLQDTSNNPTQNN